MFTLVPTARGDALGAYLERVPEGLSASAWRRFRRENPPPYMRPENRRGRCCGICGHELGPITRMCIDCHRIELEAARR